MKNKIGIRRLGVALLSAGLFSMAETPQNRQTGAVRSLSAGYERVSRMNDNGRLGHLSPTLLKKDRGGAVWAAVSGEFPENNSISIGPLLPSGDIGDAKIIRIPGFNHSPDFDFDATNSTWATWIQSADGICRILARNLSSEKTLVLAQGREGSLSGPKIVFTPDNTAWIFWEGHVRDKEGILYCRIRGNVLSKSRLLDTGNPYPDVNPDAAVDRFGRIFLTWSGYDGTDYEIYVACWSGGAWSPPARLTNDLESDSFPSIAVMDDGRIAIAWVRTSGRESVLAVSLGDGSTWSAAAPAFRIGSLESVPRVYAEDGRLGFVWKSDAGIESRDFPLLDIRRSERRTPQPAPPPQSSSAPLIVNPKPDENKYIGFGDSITYGTINHEYFPELGYIPRLKILLTQVFGTSDVINEGVGGELTAQGLARIPSVLAANAARHLLLMEGTNDIIFMNVTVASSAFNLKEMVKKCINAGVFPAIATTIPRRDFQWGYASVRERFYLLNDEIRKIAADLLVPLVEQYNAFNNYPASDGGLMSLLSEDLKHPNEKGYQVMAQTWFNEIKAFPFPPVNIQIKRRDFVWDSDFNRMPAAAALSSALRTASYPDGKGNLLTWAENSKALDKTRFKGYNIYRKKKSQTDDAYRWIVLVTDLLKYFDTKITVSESYSYIISTLRTDGVEGPCSAAVVR